MSADSTSVLAMARSLSCSAVRRRRREHHLPNRPLRQSYACHHERVRDCHEVTETGLLFPSGRARRHYQLIGAEDIVCDAFPAAAQPTTMIQIRAASSIQATEASEKRQNVAEERD